MAEEYVLRVEDLKKDYPVRKGLLHPRGVVRAVDGVSFAIARGKTMALVGESGCGKTTTGRMILRLGGGLTGGRVLFEGQDLYSLSQRELRRLRPKMQIVFQDPFSSLSPRMPVGELIGEAVREHKIVPPREYHSYIDGIMEDCGLQSYHKNRYPHEFSGGQRQRICIARALALKPSFVVCDEPVSALDVSVQAQIVNLLKRLQRERGLTYLFISHDLSVVEHIADSVGVMYLGKMVEYAQTGDLFASPMHPYTRALLSAIPVPDPDRKPERIRLKTVSSVPEVTEGCPFYPRCPEGMEQCVREAPAWIEAEPGHWCACHLYSQSRGRPR